VRFYNAGPVRGAAGGSSETEVGIDLVFLRTISPLDQASLLNSLRPLFGGRGVDSL
jgi:hypothetical protein